MIHEIEAKSILRKQKRIDSWFLCSYGINLYRGCSHNCVYCDGRDEKYQVEGDFGTDVSVKINAPTLLERELDPDRKRKPMPGGFIFVCGGVSDSYQHFEKQYGLTRSTLEQLSRFGHPVHMLTKSTMIERDLGLLKEIDKKSRAVVSFSFSTVDDSLGRLLEPGVPAPSARLDTLKRFADAGFSCGVCLMPVVPFITDSVEMIEASVAAVKDAGASFVLFSGMTLKPGRQKDYFMNFIKDNFPGQLPAIQQLYSNNSPWGEPGGTGRSPIDSYFAAAASKYNMPKRMPSSIWAPLVNTSEQIVLTLEQLDYLAGIAGRSNPYGTAARSLSAQKQHIEDMSSEELCRLRGVGKFTAKLIREIAETGRCVYYEKLL